MDQEVATTEEDVEVDGDVDAEDEDLIVDADDLRVTTQYSPPTQTYSSSDSEVVSQEREICSPDDAQQVNSTVNSTNETSTTTEMECKREPCDNNVTTSDTGSPQSRAELLKELKAKIRDLESTGNNEDEVTNGPPGENIMGVNNNYRCLICNVSRSSGVNPSWKSFANCRLMACCRLTLLRKLNRFFLQEHYKNPVISTTCWHVHCEKCWFQALVRTFEIIFYESIKEFITLQYY